jgi:hypothetical protein
MAIYLVLLLGACVSTDRIFRSLGRADIPPTGTHCRDFHLT